DRGRIHRRSKRSGLSNGDGRCRDSGERSESGVRRVDGSRWPPSERGRKSGRTSSQGTQGDGEGSGGDAGQQVEQCRTTFEEGAGHGAQVSGRELFSRSVVHAAREFGRGARIPAKGDG